MQNVLSACVPFLLDLMNWYLYKCFPLPSSRWDCLNGDFILKSVMSSQNIDGGLFPQRYRNSSLFCYASLMIQDGRVCSNLMTITSWMVSRIVLIIASSCRRRYNRDRHVICQTERLNTLIAWSYSMDYTVCTSASNPYVLTQ